jgi:CopG family nickel-responsive transcriptional regulator
MNEPVRRPRPRRTAASPGVNRFAISMPADLAARLDKWVARRNSPSRSEAIRFLVDRELATEPVASDPEADALAAVILLYRHDAPRLLERLTRAEHRWGEHIRSTSHVHLEGDACAETILLAGRRREVEEAVADLRGVKGIKEARAVFVFPSTAGGRTGHRHPHSE